MNSPSDLPAEDSPKARGTSPFDPLFAPLLARIRAERAAWLWVGGNVLAISGLVMAWYFRGRGSFEVWFLFCMGLVLLGGGKLRRWTPPCKSLALRIEQFDPSLEGRLLTAVEQGDAAGWSYAQQRLFSEVESIARGARWELCVPGWRLGLAHFADLTLACLAIAALVLCRVVPSPHSMDLAAVAAPVVLLPEVQPGSVEIEKGTRLSVTARLREVSPEVRLVGQSGGGEPFSMPMQQSLTEPLYGSGLAAVDADLEYWVETPSGASDRFSVRVFEYPKLLRSDAVVQYPAGMEPAQRTFENARKLTVPEGSSVRWELQFNKPLKAARLRHKEGRLEELAVTPKVTSVLWAMAELTEPVSARLELEDAHGRSARETPEFQVQVLPNQPPKVRPILPKADARFTKIEEVDFVAEVWDDRNLKRWGVTVQIGTGEPVELVLGQNSQSGAKVRMSETVALEEKGLEPGDSLSWFFWAEDMVRGGQVRRVESDLMLGRIRPFEEEYTQGEDSEGESEKSGPQLLELQKQVLAATWNLRKKEAGAEAAKGVATVRSAEAKVLEMAGEAAAKESDFVRKGYYEEARGHLEKAVELLGGKPEAVAGLDAALQAERSAYAALTHLAPSAYQMSKGKPSKAQEKTAQMSNLEFAKQEDRYEAKSEAQSAQQKEERSEMEELLAQLRALARRQEEVSERMRELDATLRGAGDEKEKEAARRELKRLADEQKALAQELESAQQKAAAKGEALANQAPQLDAAREAAQKAASAAERGAVDEARAAAARSSEKLREGGDALRQQLSGQTRESARELQERARQLAEQEQKLTEALDPEKKAPGKLQEPSLRKELGEQRQKLSELQAEIQRVAESSEASEPLFSKALQEAHRGTVQNQTDAKLKVASDALAYGQPALARRAEAAAAKDLTGLSDAVGKAADEVFGDDAQALKKARAVVDALAREAQPEGGQPAQPGQPGQQGQQGQQGQGDPMEIRSPAARPVNQGAGAEAGVVAQNGSYQGGGDGTPAQKLGEWLGQLDRVEALLERPHLRAAVARVQQSAEQLRADMKRNATKPSPKAIEDGLLVPLAQLRDAISSELARKAGRESEGPVDRDPVPRKFEESVRRYYEALGGSR